MKRLVAGNYFDLRVAPFDLAISSTVPAATAANLETDLGTILAVVNLYVRHHQLDREKVERQARCVLGQYDLDHGAVER